MQHTVHVDNMTRTDYRPRSTSTTNSIASSSVGSAVELFVGGVTQGLYHLLPKQVGALCFTYLHTDFISKSVHVVKFPFGYCFVLSRIGIHFVRQSLATDVERVMLLWLIRVCCFTSCQEKKQTVYCWDHGWDGQRGNFRSRLSAGLSIACFCVHLICCSRCTMTFAITFMITLDRLLIRCRILYRTVATNVRSAVCIQFIIF